MAANELTVRTEELTKQFDDSIAVCDLDLAIRETEVFGLLGPDGAGKSTTFDLLLDHVRPSAGTATVLGFDSRAEDRMLHERIGVLGDDYSLHPGMSGREHVEFAIASKGTDDSPDAILGRIGLDSKDASRPSGDYSDATTQRVAFGMALVGDPDLLILDEPFTGLEPTGEREMYDIVREEGRRGTTVMLASSHVAHVEAVCDRVAVLDNGRLVSVTSVDTLRDVVDIAPHSHQRTTFDGTRTVTES